MTTPTISLFRRLDGDYPLAYAPKQNWDDMPCFFCQRAPMGGGEEGTTCDHCEILYHHHDDPCNRFGQFVALAVRDDRAYMYADRLLIVPQTSQRRSLLIELMMPVLFGKQVIDYDGYTIMESHGASLKYFVPQGVGARLDDSTVWLWYCEHCDEFFGGCCD